MAQKVPLNRDRNNVKPAYLKAVRTLVLNAMHERLTEEDANADWVRQATSDPNCSAEAIKKVLDLRFGDKFAAFDPNDKEANKNFVAQGGASSFMARCFRRKNGRMPRKPVPSSRLARSARRRSRSARTTPMPRNVTIIPQEKWTRWHDERRQLLRVPGQGTDGRGGDGHFVNTPNNFLAAYGRGGNLIFNVFRLGHAWFENGSQGGSGHACSRMNSATNGAATIFRKSTMRPCASWQLG